MAQDQEHTTNSTNKNLFNVDKNNDPELRPKLFSLSDSLRSDQIDKVNINKSLLDHARSIPRGIDSQFYDRLAAIAPMGSNHKGFSYFDFHNNSVDPNTGRHLIEPTEYGSTSMLKSGGLGGILPENLTQAPIINMLLDQFNNPNNEQTFSLRNSNLARQEILSESARNNTYGGQIFPTATDNKEQNESYRAEGFHRGNHPALLYQASQQSINNNLSASLRKSMTEVDMREIPPEYQQSNQYATEASASPSSFCDSELISQNFVNQDLFGQRDLTRPYLTRPFGMGPISKITDQLPFNFIPASHIRPIPAVTNSLRRAQTPENVKHWLDEYVHFMDKNRTTSSSGSENFLSQGQTLNEVTINQPTENQMISNKGSGNRCYRKIKKGQEQRHNSKRQRSKSKSQKMNKTFKKEPTKWEEDSTPSTSYKALDTPHNTLSVSGPQINTPITKNEETTEDEIRRSVAISMAQFAAYRPDAPSTSSAPILDESSPEYAAATTLQFLASTSRHTLPKIDLQQQYLEQPKTEKRKSNGMNFKGKKLKTSSSSKDDQPQPIDLTESDEDKIENSVQLSYNTNPAFLYQINMENCSPPQTEALRLVTHNRNNDQNDDITNVESNNNAK